MNPLRLTQIEMFCAVVEEGTVVAASHRLNCVASNVTARIRELEALLGQSLFLREKGRLSVTPEGRLFYRRAKLLVDEARALHDLFSDGTPKGILSVGALDVALIAYLPRIVPAFLRACPRVELRLLQRPTYTIEQMLTEGEIDLALTDGPIVHPMLQSRFAFREELVLVMPVGQERVEKGQHVFLYNTDCFYRRYFETWLAAQGVLEPVIHTIESYDVILGSVRAGLGISCFPRSVVDMLRSERLDGVHCLSPDDLQGSGVYFVWREPGLNDLGRSFMEHAPCVGESFINSE